MHPGCAGRGQAAFESDFQHGEGGGPGILVLMAFGYLQCPLDSGGGSRQQTATAPSRPFHRGDDK